ncbi:MAG: DUF1611 domain-containing protein [Gammaproteobacteria bacterium]|nr:DUF1611 domain-containing protein [Gammaproteobacteria bacterium]MDH4256275.1 DUF1611 domain-containing protein [Gammaproteobacteria bacterium]MDH5311655.1 DUF1611 domain-containing protein [Gammaproteobacteria bacterium]
MSVIQVSTPYLVFLGAVSNPLDAKTGRGLVDWRPEQCIGQLRYPGCRVDLGLPDMSPAEAVAAGAKSLVIGIAPTGGQLDRAWLDTLAEALNEGLDLVAGMHTRLASVFELATRAQALGRRLVDVRVPPPGIPVASGRRRSGRRVLMVGTDCCVGKKYSALALHRALEAAGRPATFRATGQTGILIAGSGIPMDAVVSDFLSGAAEALSPDNDAGHWDVIEGQGSLFHPAYAAVTLGLIHGSQPDALVLCHEHGRTQIDEYPGYPIPPLAECIDTYLRAARLTNPDVRFVGVSLNTAALTPAARADALAAVTAETGLPCVDPMAGGLAAIVERLP